MMHGVDPDAGWNSCVMVAMDDETIMLYDPLQHSMVSGCQHRLACMLLCCARLLQTFPLRYNIRNSSRRNTQMGGNLTHSTHLPCHQMKVSEFLRPSYLAVLRCLLTTVIADHVFHVVDGSACFTGKPGSIPGWITPGFLLLGIMLDNVAGQLVFSGIFDFPCPSIQEVYGIFSPCTIVDELVFMCEQNLVWIKLYWVDALPWACMAVEHSLMETGCSLMVKAKQRQTLVVLESSTRRALKNGVAINPEGTTSLVGVQGRPRGRFPGKGRWLMPLADPLVASASGRPLELEVAQRGGRPPRLLAGSLELLLDVGSGGPSRDLR
ncbi:hypothetical protein PR048_020847 [Dryococelus australis]|uniref:Uncharacterized protein n=1 Tax=Dryococelus australis TaxID=614101 RepID=A0ABQ9GWJ9_9NEOP|nr:hypothetical protein PR048_020847 [Dryococelus australis]